MKVSLPLTFLSTTNSFSAVVRLWISSSYLWKGGEGWVLGGGLESEVGIVLSGPVLEALQHTLHILQLKVMAGGHTCKTFCCSVAPSHICDSKFQIKYPYSCQKKTQTENSRIESTLFLGCTSTQPGPLKKCAPPSAPPPLLLLLDWRAPTSSLAPATLCCCHVPQCLSHTEPYLERWTLQAIRSASAISFFSLAVLPLAPMACYSTPFPL